MFSHLMTIEMTFTRVRYSVSLSLFLSLYLCALGGEHYFVDSHSLPLRYVLGDKKTGEANIEKEDKIFEYLDSPGNKR